MQKDKMACSQVTFDRYKEKAIKDYRDAPVGQKHPSPKLFPQVHYVKVQCYSQTHIANGTVVPACFKTFIDRQEH